MTGAILASIYLVALASFLGLDIISKVPPTLYGLVLAGLGALTGVTVVGAFWVLSVGAGGEPDLLGRVGLGLAAASAVGGSVAIGRLLGAFSSKKTHTS